MIEKKSMANAFAAGLLMPESFLRQDVKKLSVDFDDATQVEALAERYRVSAQAMTFRLLNLLDELVLKSHSFVWSDGTQGISTNFRYDTFGLSEGPPH
jgi:Zn-dependent peptidase ImmA (M78 family)